MNIIRFHDVAVNCPVHLLFHLCCCQIFADVWLDMFRMLRLSRSVVMSIFLSIPELRKSIILATCNNVKVCMAHSLTGMLPLIELKIDVYARIQRLCHFRGPESCPCKDFGGSGARNVCAWNDEDVAIGCWINGLEDKDFRVPRTVMDICDCLFLVSNDGAKLAVFIKGDFSLCLRYGGRTRVWHLADRNGFNGFCD